MATVKGGCSPVISFTQFAAIGATPADDTPVAVLALRGAFNASGVAADQCDLIYARPLTFVASTPQTLDLTALTDPAGNAISFARVRFLAIRIRDTTAGHVLLVGGAGTNEWGGFLSSGAILTVFPSTAANDGFFLLPAPNTTGIVVSGTSKLLKLDPGAVALGIVDVVIAGCSL
jgi:hypothetical protein